MALLKKNYYYSYIKFHGVILSTCSSEFYGKSSSIFSPDLCNAFYHIKVGQ